MRHLHRVPSIVFASAVLALLACASSDSDEVTREKCERFRDHVIDLQLARLPSSLAPTRVVTPADPRAGADHTPTSVDLPAIAPDLAGHRAAMTAALGEGFVTSCQRSLSAAQLKCGLAASDPVSATECETSASK